MRQIYAPAQTSPSINQGKTECIQDGKTSKIKLHGLIAVGRHVRKDVLNSDTEFPSLFGLKVFSFYLFDV